MTLTFEVNPKLAQRVEKVRSSGVDVDMLFARWVETLPTEEIAEAARLALIEAGFGKFAGYGKVDDVLAERQNDLALETQRLENR